MSNSTTRMGWHFIRTSRRLSNGDGRAVRVGVKMKWEQLWPEDQVTICSRGMHASPTITDAFSYAGDMIADGWLCRVRVHGTNYSNRSNPHQHSGQWGGAKFVGTHRTVLGMVKVSDLRFGNLLSLYNPDKHRTAILELMRKRNRKNGVKIDVE